MNKINIKELNIKECQLPRNLLELATNAQKSKDTKINELLAKRKWPEKGWSNDLIEYFVRQIADMDSNNFEKHYSLGEREGRVICDLVRRRHFGLAHGVGRSGNLAAPQPKAVGSSLLSNITEAMVLDWLHFQGLTCCQRAAVVPLATGMTLTLCFLFLKKKRPLAKYIIWSRIDQVSCVKSMTMAGFQPIVIDTIPITSNEENKYCGEGLITDLMAFENVLEDYKNKSQEILCIMSTSSCFAPRNCDNLEALAILAKKYNIPHVVNNAYGLQSTYLTHQLQQAHRVGRVDLFIQSTDKNLMVPVGGAIVGSASEDIVNQVIQTYAGRGASTPTLDVFMTLLNLGRNSYAELCKERKEHFQSLSKKLQQFVNHYDCGSVVCTKGNPISIAITFNNLSDKCLLKELGARLFTRGVTGARAIVPGLVKTIDNCTFNNWGCHTNHCSLNQPYLTVAASIGIKNYDIEQFIKKLTDCWLSLKDKHLGTSHLSV